MWVCSKHMKKLLAELEIPHISKVSYEIKCSLCENPASAKIFFAHKPFKCSSKYQIV
jgi:hypothetical protein